MKCLECCNIIVKNCIYGEWVLTYIVSVKPAADRGDGTRSRAECCRPTTHYPAGSSNLVCCHLTLGARLLLHDFCAPNEVSYTAFATTATNGFSLGNTHCSPSLQALLGHHHCLHWGSKILWHKFNSGLFLFHGWNPFMWLAMFVAYTVVFL